MINIYRDCIELILLFYLSLVLSPCFHFVLTTDQEYINLGEEGKANDLLMVCCLFFPIYIFKFFMSVLNLNQFYIIDRDSFLNIEKSGYIPYN